MARTIAFTENGRKYRIIVENPDVGNPVRTTVALFSGDTKIWERLLAPGENESEAVGEAQEFARNYSL